MAGETQASRYTLRVPVRTLGEGRVTGFESPLTDRIDDLELSIHAAPPLLVIMVDGFESEEAAKHFIPRVVAGIWALLVRWNIAYRGSFELQKVAFAEDSVDAGKCIAAFFGLPASEPIDGMAGAEDTVIFPSEKLIRWMSIGEARVEVQTAAS